MSLEIMRKKVEYEFNYYNINAESTIRTETHTRLGSKNAKTEEIIKKYVNKCDERRRENKE